MTKDVVSVRNEVQQRALEGDSGALFLCGNRVQQDKNVVCTDRSKVQTSCGRFTMIEVKCRYLVAGRNRGR